MATSPKQNELVQLQSQITSEVNRDAPAIAQGIFGDNANHPDMASVSNQQLDDLYRQKYQSGDRQWLQAEARRDPNQFMDVAKRIGVQMPDPNAPPPPSPQATQQAMAQMLSSALQPQAGPAPAAPAGLPAAAPALPPPPVSPAMPLAPAAGGMVPSVAGPVGAALVPPSGPAAPPPVILGPNGQPLPPSIPGVTG